MILEARSDENLCSELDLFLHVASSNLGALLQICKLSRIEIELSIVYSHLLAQRVI